MKIKTIKINDLITVSFHKDTKSFRLVDIAVWKVEQSIKTIFMREVEIDYLTRTDKVKNKKAQNKLIRESVALFNHEDKFIVEVGDETAVYQIKVKSAYRDPFLIGGVYFQKMVTT